MNEAIRSCIKLVSTRAMVTAIALLGADREETARATAQFAVDAYAELAALEAENTEQAARIAVLEEALNGSLGVCRLIAAIQENLGIDGRLENDTRALFRAAVLALEEKQQWESALTHAPSGMVPVERDWLKKIEWLPVAHYPWDKCAAGCGARRWSYTKKIHTEHAPDCWLAAKLKEGDDEAN